MMRAPSGASLTKAIPHPDDLAHLESRLRDSFLEVIHAAGETAASRFEHFANQETHPAALTAAPGVGPSTAMVAVYPTDEQAAAMRQPNGEDSAILHVTLAFLGELEPDRAEMAAGVARKVAAANQALSGSVGGVGAFGDNGAGHPSILMPDVVGLAELRHAVCTALCDAGIHFVGCQCSGLERDSSRTEHGWNPHLTLGYHDELTVPPKHLLGRPLDFGQLSFAQGDVRRDFDFAAEGDWVLPALGVSEPVYGGIHAITREDISETVAVRAWMSDQTMYIPSRARAILIKAGALTAGAVVAESETGIEIGNVAKAHAEAAAPDYGDTYWNEVEQTVFWISADWTSIDEADAAIADFLAIDEVQNVEECAECGSPAGDGWEKVYTSSSVDPPADELPEENALVAAGPPWTQPHPDELVDVDTLVSRFRGKADPVRRAAVEAAAAPALDKAGLSFDATNPFVDAVTADIGQHVTFIADTTRLNVMRIVRRSYEDGLSIPDTAKAIREGMAAAAGSRATLIARTEMTSLVNGGGLAAMNVVTDAGVGTYLKRWLTAPGASYPRHEDYDGLDGQTVALNGVFDVGGVSLAYPGDPDGPPDEVCNCRCTLIYVESGEASAGDISGEEGASVEPEDFAVAAPPPGDTISVGTSDFVPAAVVAKIKELGLDHRLEDMTPTSKIGRETYAHGKDTATLYKPGGEWTPDRAALHDKIVAAYFDGKVASGERTVYFTAGGGASGKSAAIFDVAGKDVGLKELGARNDTIWIDPDRIKAMLPEYNQLRDAGDFYAANGVHEESSELAKRIQAEAQRRGFSVILDTTGSSSTFVQKLEAAKAAGYEVKVTMFSIPTNEAIVRSMARAEKKGGASEGRYVSIEALKNAHAGASRQMAIWKDSPAVSEWRVYDNTGKEPELVAEGGASKAKVIDPNVFNSIIAKAEERPGSTATVAPTAPARGPSVATLVPGPAPSVRDAVDSYQQYGVERYAAAYRLNETDARARINEAIANAVKDSEVRLRVTPDVLANVLEDEDGRFKSQFETGTSHGLLDHEYRSDAEQKMFGYPTSLPASERPIYGYLSGSALEGDGQLSRMYGKTIVRFNDDVRDRATFTLSDSLGAGRDEEITPQPVTSPNLRALFMQKFGTDLPIPAIDPTLERMSTGYAEAQIHGGLRVGDIAEVVFEKGDISSEAGKIQASIDGTDAFLKDTTMKYEEWVSEGRAPDSLEFTRRQIDDANARLEEMRQTLELMKNDGAEIRRRLTAAGIPYRIVDSLDSV